jgi:hypothetical protein
MISEVSKKMTKIRLLNDGGYGDMDDVKFPVEVEAKGYLSNFTVSSDELYRVGAARGKFDITRDEPMPNKWIFMLGSECEVIEMTDQSQNYKSLGLAICLASAVVSCGIIYSIVYWLCP